MSQFALEKELLLLSVLKYRTSDEQQRLEEICENQLDWGWIGGQLFHHRLSGYFYFGLGQLRKKLLVNEFDKALQLIVKAQAQQAKEINEIILPILNEFEAAGIRYAALKGLVFNATLYGPGERRSNDSDILVSEEDLDKLDQILRKHGYIQTYMENGEYKEASRKAKMIQRMNYHDLVPYIKLVDSEFISHHEIDVNFHFDSKDNDITKAVFDFGTYNYSNDNYEVKGLPWETHMAQLCVHFYREGSSSLWSKGRRDVVLYKMIDVVNTIRVISDEQRMIRWVDMMKELNLNKACYYTLYYANQFYPDLVAKEVLLSLKPEDVTYLEEIAISGEDKVVRRRNSFTSEALNLVYKK
ncbi:nucleotidyltransferase family protein [Paenibacillus kobensis]|uniref:nucleotidyltransferase family protein n=1 Tax=Paenibacillus kobensis TaxID=59841 RepID=UPI0013E3D207|nr:nucleotidyltransferase family protein [Paenibacillus kobensis]